MKSYIVILEGGSSFARNAESHINEYERFQLMIEGVVVASFKEDKVMGWSVDEIQEEPDEQPQKTKEKGS